MDDMLRVGVITSTHGIKGEVKVYPTTDDPSRFKKLKKVYLVGDSILGKMNKKVSLEICSVKFFKQFVIVKFKDIEDINDVEKYKGMDIYIDREDAIPLEEGEYYITDLIGINVYEDSKLVGVVADVLQTAANDVYEIELDSDFVKESKAKSNELLLPATKECIQSIDLDTKSMHVKILEGLLDL